MIKFGLPEKVNEMAERCRWWHPVIIILEVVGMKEFNMLHDQLAS